MNFIQQRIAQIKNGTNPYFVAELLTGYVVLCDFQFFPGYTLFVCKKNVVELHELKPDYKRFFLNEMSLVGESVWQVFQPQKLNYELLGNTDRHLHWHIIPRYGTDAFPAGPIWYIPKEDRQVMATELQLKTFKKQLLEQLKSNPEVTIIKDYLSKN